MTPTEQNEIMMAHHLTKIATPNIKSKFRTYSDLQPSNIVSLHLTNPNYPGAKKCSPRMRSVHFDVGREVIMTWWWLLIGA